MDRWSALRHGRGRFCVLWGAVDIAFNVELCYNNSVISSFLRFCHNIPTL